VTCATTVPSIRPGQQHIDFDCEYYVWIIAQWQGVVKRMNLFFVFREYELARLSFASRFHNDIQHVGRRKQHSTYDYAKLIPRAEQKTDIPVDIDTNIK
jgi:hypothetical protein